jgi:ribosomal protein L28
MLKGKNKKKQKKTNVKRHHLVQHHLGKQQKIKICTEGLPRVPEVRLVRQKRKKKT